MAYTDGRDMMLLHGFEQCRLCFRGRAVDFVGENHIGKDWPLYEDHFPFLAGLLEYFGAGNISRHKVRRELDAAERAGEDICECPDQHRLSQTRNSFQQGVPSSQQGHHQIMNQFALSHNHLD